VGLIKVMVMMVRMVMKITMMTTLMLKIEEHMAHVQAPPERWPELEPKVTETIEHLFGYYGDDAGWSPDALEALGIEVKAPPEPQK